MQKLTLIGNIGNEPTIKKPKNGGEEFLSFTVACNQVYKNAEGVKVEKTTWYDCIFKRTKLAPHIKKGHQIHIEGTPSFSMYEDKEGKSQISVTVSVSEINLLNNKKEETAK